MSENLKLRFLCEAHYASGKSFLIPFTTNLSIKDQSTIIGIGLCAELRKKYPDSEFWLEDYMYLDFNTFEVNQSTNSCFGYDGCYDSLIIVENYIVNRVPSVHISLDTIVNINNISFTNSSVSNRVDHHTTKSLKKYVHNSIYYKLSKKVLKSYSTFSEGIEHTKIMSKDIDVFLDKLFEGDDNKSLDNIEYEFEGYKCTFSCTKLHTLKDLIPFIKTDK